MKDYARQEVLAQPHANDLKMIPGRGPLRNLSEKETEGQEDMTGEMTETMQKIWEGANPVEELSNFMFLYKGKAWSANTLPSCPVSQRASHAHPAGTVCERARNRGESSILL